MNFILQISNLVHNQVQSHWNNKSHYPNNNVKNRYNHIDNSKNDSHLIGGSLSHSILEAVKTYVVSEFTLNEKMKTDEAHTSPNHRDFSIEDIPDLKKSLNDAI